MSDVKSYIDIDGEVRDVEELDMSNADRKFRDAWQFNGDVVEHDVDKMRPIAKKLVYEWAGESKDEPIEVGGVRYLCTPTARANISEKIQYLNSNSPGQVNIDAYYAADEYGDISELTEAELRDLYNAIVVRSDQIETDQKSHVDAINAATTSAEIEAIIDGIGK